MPLLRHFGWLRCLSPGTPGIDGHRHTEDMLGVACSETAFGQDASDCSGGSDFL
jgi:hypothetical protein